MKIAKCLVGIVAFVSLGSACEVFEDLTPEFINLRVSGTPGTVVSVIYSKQFVAGVDEIGVTRVEIFGADTVMHVLPIDTIIDVRLERRIYIQAESLPTDTLAVDVRVEVDTRELFDRSGDLFPTIPWQFLYQFNATFTDDIEVVI